MAPPYGPSDFKNLIPAANASWCKKLIQIPGLLAVYAYRMMKWAVKDDLTATDDFKAWVGLSTSSSLTAPTNVTASDGTSSTSVVVSWTAVAGASYYQVYRSLGSVFSGATLVGTSTTNSYTDSTVVVSTTYTYWVKAASASATSDESVPDTGYAEAGGATSRTYTVSDTFTVPAGVTSIDFTMWAKGGDGGERGAPPWGLPGTYSAGGGGGGGEYAAGTIPVTPLEDLSIIISSTGSAIQRSSTVLASVVAGEVGFDGGVSPGAGGDGGTGGTFDGTVTSTTRNAGTVGFDGDSGGSGGGGGATTPLESGYGSGGDGSDADTSNSSNGLPSKIVLNW